MEYTPILRFKPVELKILERIPTGNIFPLLEIVDLKTFGNINNVRSRFKNKIMVDLPRHLMQGENKHFGGVMSIFQSFGGNNFSSLQTDFYKKNSSKIDIPVVSSTRADIPNYKELVDGFKAIQIDFPTIAVRIFVNAIDIRQSPASVKELELLAGTLRESDIILLDVVSFDGVESYIMRNLGNVIKIFSGSKTKRVVILNAFDSDGDWRKDPHNYAPLLAKHFGILGFGDLATIPRIENAGGSSTTTSVIRFFSPWDVQLINFKSSSFLKAKQDLIKSHVWQKSTNNGHFKSCPYCQEVFKKDTEWKTFWKFFRIEHHINCMITDIIPNMIKFGNTQDFDMIGFNNIFKKAS